jgi:spore coat protein A, manganese oxidase
MSPLSRRAFVGLLGAATVGVGVGVPLLSGWRGAPTAGTLLPSRLPLPRPFQRPLPRPAVLAPVRVDATTDWYEIVQREADAEILPGVRTRVWGYDGVFPGPTLVTTSGRRTVVRHRNELPVPTVTHLHGGRTPAEHDGYPIDLLLPVGSRGVGGHSPHLATGAHRTGTREYVYPSDQRAATLWYHDHRMDFTGASVWRGLAGFHLVRDDEERSLGLPAGPYDLPLLIADRSFAADGSLLYPSLDPSLVHRPGVTPEYAAGVLGDVMTVNGVAWPVAEVPAVRHRLRLLNAGNARALRLALDPPPPGGNGLVLVGTDGGLLERSRGLDAVEVAPGQRYDVVVDFGRYRPGDTVTVVNEFGAGSTRPVLRFQVGPRARDDSRVPAVLSPSVGAQLAALDPAAAVRTRTFDFRAGDLGGMTGWLVNGRPFDPLRADAETRLGEVEVWRLRSDFHHPIHIHLAHVRVVGRRNGGPGPFDDGFKDTLDLRPFEEISVVVRFTDYPGRYVLHCHNLEHEDMAMMANVVTS